MSRLRALFLDFDGLVCDTERAAHESWTRTYARFGLAFPTELWMRMAGRRDGEDLAKRDLTRRLGRPLTEQVWADRRRCKHLLADRLGPRPGVAQLLSEGAALGWLTLHLTRLGLDRHLTAVVSGDEVRRHKPAPDVYRLALARLGVAADEAVAFEDAPVGVRAARAAGIRCVAVPNEVGEPADLQEADVVLPSLHLVDLRKLEEVLTR